MPNDDFIQRFLFQDFNVRGEMVRLGPSYREVLGQRDYPSTVRHGLGQMLAATALLSATLKFRGSMTLQANSEGPLRLMMAECRDHSDLRAIARFDADTPNPWLGEGHLVITIEPHGGERYQGIVTLEQDSLARAIESYFQRSEQLDTRLWLVADGECAAGMMLQRLPDGQGADKATADEDWRRVELLADTVRDEELLSLQPRTVLERLFHEEQVRLFDPRSVRFACSCSRERSANAIKFLGYDEAMSLVAEQGEVEIDCQFCHARYRFGGDDVRGVFAREAAPEGTTVH